MEDIFVVAVDFDGTLCENVWPDIGAPNKLLIDSLKEFKNVITKKVKIILWTCRSGQLLKNAVTWCKAHGLEFDAVNKNVPEAIAMFGKDSRKIYADVYIDDKNVDCGEWGLPYKYRNKRRRKNEVSEV